MATTGNADWAFREAKRRAGALVMPVSIYEHRRNTDDFIVRSTAAAPPNTTNWQRVATFEPDGSKSFERVATP